MPTSLSDLDQYDPDLDPVDNIIAQQRRAQYSATQGLASELDPANAARAIDMEQLTKVPASIIALDQNRFEAQHKAAVTRAMLNNNQYLADYANSHSLASTVSKNDWAHLDDASQAIQQFGDSPLINIGVQQTKAAIEGFRKGFGDEPLGSQYMELTDEQKRFQDEHPTIWGLIKDDAYDIAKGADLMNRTLAGGFGAVHGVLKGVFQRFGYDDQTAEQGARNIMGVVEAEFARQMAEPIKPGLGRTPEEIQAAQLQNQLDARRAISQAREQITEAANIAKPFVDAGKSHPTAPIPSLTRSTRCLSSMR